MCSMQSDRLGVVVVINISGLQVADIWCCSRFLTVHSFAVVAHTSQIEHALRHVLFSAVCHLKPCTGPAEHLM